MESSYNGDSFTKHGMHLNRRGKGLVSKQLATEIWKLPAAEGMPLISLGQKTVEEQIVSRCALVPGTRKADGDCLAEELEIILDKIRKLALQLHNQTSQSIQKSEETPRNKEKLFLW
jgi:hypothetical protein